MVEIALNLYLFADNWHILRLLNDRHTIGKHPTQFPSSRLVSRGPLQPEKKLKDDNFVIFSKRFKSLELDEMVGIQMLFA